MAILPVGIGPQEGGYQIERSLRFNSADSAYLSRTPASAGNRKTWTWSGWVKRSKLASASGETLFFAYDTGASPWNGTNVYFLPNDKLRIQQSGSTTNFYYDTDMVFRDVGAWYHIMIAVDLTQSTSTNRIKFYVNGSQVSAPYAGGLAVPGSSDDTWVNAVTIHNIGTSVPLSAYFNGYMSDVYLIDGQQLDPTSFGEYNTDTGVWQPKAYTGSYGTNGFYLPMTQDQIVEGFNTVLYRSGLGKNRVTGVGFKPSMVWVKNRDVIQEPSITDAVRGVNSQLRPAYTSAESTYTDCLTSFDADGFTLGTDATNNSYNYYSGNAVAWCWDAGNSTVSNTDGTITSSVRASQTYGFSVVTWTNAGNGNDTVGHGLGTAPKLIITKKRSTANDWYTFTTAIDGSYDYLKLNATDAKVDSAKAAPTSTVFTTDMGDTSTAVAYCFTDSNYSKFGSYTGNGSSSGPTVTLGWKPAFVLIKKTSDVDDWAIFDTTRQTTNGITKVLNINSASEATGTSPYITISDTGFQITATSNMVNTNGGTYIYAAFKDQREAAFWRDFSGNGNHWQPNNLDFNDSVVDVPTNYGTDTGVGGEVRGNYCTLNPLNQNSTGVTLSNGNLDVTRSSTSNGQVWSTMGMTSGKWYAEVTAGADVAEFYIGIANGNMVAANRYLGQDSNTWAYYPDGRKVNSGTYSSYGNSWTSGNVIGIAFDADAGALYFYKDGVVQNSGTAAFTSLTSGPYFYACSAESLTASSSWNFGQRPFAYAAPSGFKALCTQNLPTPTILDGADYFNATLWTGNGATQTITTGLANDLVWTKDRGAAYDHTWFDVLRTPGYFLRSNSTSAEEYRADSLTGFTSTGFSVGADSVRQNINKSGNAYVSWAWKAGGTGVSNTAGTITSTVSANTTAGFSIVTYTGNGSANQTVGHGLGVAPAFGILKDRDTNSNNDQWQIFHTAAGDKYGYFTTAAFAGTAEFYPTSGSSTTVTIARGSPAATTNESGDRYVMYLFAPVAGYSAFGSYTGNGSSDGPFVYTGFRPKFLLVKSATTAQHWIIDDTTRNPYNITNLELYPSLSNAESSDPSYDLLSNGFKLRITSANKNASGVTYIYAAFAESPFKYSLGR